MKENLFLQKCSTCQSFLYICRIKLKRTIMKETKLEIPAGCEVDKIETQDGHIVVTFKEKERELPKSWEDFCEMFPCKRGEYLINSYGCSPCAEIKRIPDIDVTILPDRATAEAVLALIQLIQLRNCYNGDWVPDWKNCDEIKHVIQFDTKEIQCDTWIGMSASPLYFKTKELCDEFLKYFRPLIEKLKPLYGIKEGGKEC